VQIKDCQTNGQHNLAEQRQRPPKSQKPARHSADNAPRHNQHKRGNQRRANLSHYSLAEKKIYHTYILP
jgi:hypothetical protein